MNTKYKVVFNVARGCLMVANELTKSARKGAKGTKLVVTLVGGVISLTLSNATFATEGTHTQNVIANGQSIQVTGQTPNITSSTKVVGAQEFTSAPTSPSTESSSNISVSGVTLDEIIGGFHARSIPQNPQNADLILKGSNTFVNGVTADYLVGGSKASNATNLFLLSEALHTTVEGKTTLTKGFIGGNYTKATGKPGGGPAKTEGYTSSIENNILSGIFSGNFIGGSFAENYGNNSEALKVSDGSIKTQISNGDFSKLSTIIGGSFAKGANTTALADKVELAITGGDLNYYKEDGTSARKSIYAGSAALDGGVASTAITNLVIDGTDGNFVGNKNAAGALENSKNHMIHLEVYGGGLNSTVSRETTVSIKGIVGGFLDETNKAVKSQFYAGSNLQTAGKFTEGNTSIQVHNSILLADVLGAGLMYKVSDSYLESGEASVIVKDSVLDGWTNGTNRYSGRVFGSGRIDGTSNSTMLVSSSNVLVSNVSGRDFENLQEAITHNPGSQIFGAMQSYANKKSLSYVGSTKVRIEGEKTSIAEAFGGGIISGTVNREDNSTLAVGSSFVEVAEGNIADFLVGGNNSNWFGSSVVGKLDDAGSFELNGHRFSEGSSTAVLRAGGNAETLLVIGGSLTDYADYTTEKGKRESYVFGTSSAVITGGAAKVVVGAGYATFAMEGNISGKVDDDAPVSNVKGQSFVNISGGNISDLVIGGGFAETSHSELASQANVEGNTNIILSGGTVKDIVGGGYASGPSAKADVSGDSNIIISGGTITGNIYAGGLVSQEGESSSAKVSGTATVTFLADIGFKGIVNGSNVEKATVLAFGDDSEAYIGNFEGTFTSFNELHLSAGSKVSLDSLNVKESGKEGVLKITGKGQIQSEALSLSDGSRLEILGGVLVASSANLNGGMFYLDPAWNEAPTVAAIENPSEIKSQIVVGQNSALTLGSSDAQLALNALQTSGHRLSANDITAVAYIAKPISMANGGALQIDGTAENNADNVQVTNGVSVKKDGALIVNGNVDGSLINGQTSLFFKTEAGSTVLVTDAVAGKNIQLASGFGDMTIDKDTTIKASNRIIDLKKISLDENGELVVATETNLAAIPDVLIPNTVAAAAEGKGGTGGSRINAILDTLNGLTDQQAQKALNSISLMGASSGAQTIALTASDTIQDTLIHHGSALAAYAHEKAGTDLWIDVNGRFSKADDYKAGNEKFGYKSDLAGITVGSDYSFGNGVALGLAASFGKGSVRGQGTGSGIKNDIDYYGVNLYGVWNTQYANVIGSLGYLQSKNKIKQNGYKGKPDAKSVSVGVQVEKPMNLNESFTVTPHAGIRYTHVKLDAFTSGGIAYKADNASLISLPFGVALNANLTASCGARIKPFVDLTIAPNLGDKKVKNKVGLQELGTLDSFDVRIANNAMYRGKIGAEATMGNHSFGLNYGIGGGNMGRLDQTLQAKYRYQF